MQDLPFLTCDLPGIGGNIKQYPEDFMVEERLLFPLSGNGEHLYVLVEKKNITTTEVVRILCQKLSIQKRAVGYAGQKDARAITKQHFSLHGVSEQQLKNLQGLDSCKFLSSKRHDKKLKLGQISGNFFSIVIRNSKKDITLVRKILSHLQTVGVPNYFGAQRFGSTYNTHLLGKYLLLNNHNLFAEALFQPHHNDRSRVATAKKYFSIKEYKEAYKTMPGTFEAEKVVLSNLARGKEIEYSVKRIPKKIKYFYICAYQSYLFNLSLAQRLPTLDILWDGDLAVLHPSRSVFLVDNSVKEQPRCTKNNISPSGPVFGYKMTCPRGKQLQIEKNIATQENLDIELFRDYKAKGERRSYRFFLQETDVSENEQGILVHFFLNKGCYATTVLREIMKSDNKVS
ncbi:tRNA pseudouridine(13) synthase TruD [Candidatus Uabimicrobium sp. HlEnr_7]|uniref:tRNA pseudouridine(13) synthase TruD n=1 Tax=Candidatus Uabimicrobium helgolandensis TaxID=3095367 RepID=UPI0035572EAD